MRVCMLLHKSVAFDTRVRREASALTEAGHEVTVVHLPPPGTGASGELDDLPFGLRSATLPRGRRWLPHAPRLGAEAARLAQRGASLRPDAVHAHDAAMLLPGLLAARRSGAKLVYDSHELATGVPYRGRSWATVVTAVERLGAPRADGVITVSDGIAAELKRLYGLNRLPTVVRNVPDTPPPGARPVADLRERLGVGGVPLIVHQGAAVPGRGCETLVRAVASLDDVHLVLLGASNADAERLRALAEEGGAGERLHALPTVPPGEVLSHTAQADVGVSLLEDSCDNHRMALPNKLFEYLAAGLPVVVADLPEAGRLVRERGVGWCTDSGDPESVAAALREALARRGDTGTRRRVAAAGRELRWELEKQRLLDLYGELERG
jgi:glycosyltransferase involved in cell wall biosynthesis